MAERKVYPPGAGDVTLNLGDQELVLKCNLQAGMSISRIAGGIRGAINKCMDMDLDTIVAVVRFGIGPKEAKHFPKIDEMIFVNGLMDSQGEVLSKVIEYLSNLARGGRPAPAAEEDEEDKEQADPPSPPLN
jgi:hypothetical protein